MKYLKLFGSFLVFVVIVIVILSFILPVKQQAEFSTTIQSKASDVYEQVIKLENFNTWSVWNQRDASVQHVLSGPDGENGTISSWSGDPSISGEGKMEIIGSEPGRMVKHRIQFLRPRKGNAVSTITLNEINGITSATWLFEMATPRPWNIFNLFYNMKKEMGKDFEEGLLALKARAEKNTVQPSQSYTVITLNFPATSYAIIRQTVKWSDISSFYATHISMLHDEIARNEINDETATGTGLYFVWDEKNQQTDMAAALSVPPGTAPFNAITQILDIPASKAIVTEHRGDYTDVASAHIQLDKYIADHKLKQRAPAIEEYKIGPADQKDSSKWITRIIYLVE